MADEMVRTCNRCTKGVVIPISEQVYKAWIDNPISPNLQVQFPYLNADQREILLSGICGACFDEIFPEED